MTQAVPPHSQKQNHDQKNNLIIVVDGNTVSRFTTSIILQRLDYDVFSVKSAEEAIAVIAIAPPRLVLAEIALPEMNGIDLVKKLRQEKPTKDIPIIIYTKMQDAAYRNACEQAGCSRYLLYPAEPNKLYEAIQEVTEATPRHFVRLHAFLEVAVGAESIPGHVVTRERISALSINGMYVNMLKPLPYGTVMPFSIFLRGANERSIDVDGKVLYSSSYDSTTSNVKQPGMGIKFARITPQDQELIASYIQEKLMAGIAVSI
jgi:CheY-like chemotaxis protein